MSFIAVVAAAAVGGAAAPIASAQGEPEICQHAVAELHSDYQSVSAIQNIGRCPVTGPLALSEVWARHGTRGAAVRRQLVDVTASLRDGRLFERMVDVATNSANADNDRVAALIVLMRYYDPRYVPRAQDITARRTSTRFASQPIVPMVVDGVMLINGATPMPGSAPQEVGRVFAQVAANDRDTPVRRAALALRQTLAYRDPQVTPLEAGAVVLVAGCSQRVTLQSTADIAVALEIRVLDTTFQKIYTIRAGSKSNPAKLSLWLPNGTVIASYANREIVRLSERNAPCPSGMVK